MEVIRHRTYCGGMVQELVHVVDNEVVMSSGIVLPGEHTFGQVRRKQSFIVTSGSLIIGGHKVDSGYECSLGPGDELEIIAEVRGSYVRHYE